MNAQKLMKTGVFKDRMDLVYYFLMKCIQENEHPVGSWVLTTYLDARGIKYSTASVGRFLAELDAKALTMRHSNCGRKLTPLGQQQLETIDRSIDRANKRNAVSSAMQVTHISDLLDLFDVRVAIEKEMVRSAAIRATEEDMALLDAALEEHYRCVRENLDPNDAAVKFHTVIGEICHNKTIAAIIDLLMLEEGCIESKINNLVTRELNRFYAEDHAKIARAIRTRQVELAVSEMEAHLEKIRNDIVAQGWR